MYISIWEVGLSCRLQLVKLGLIVLIRVSLYGKAWGMSGVLVKMIVNLLEKMLVAYLVDRAVIGVV